MWRWRGQIPAVGIGRAPLLILNCVSYCLPPTQFWFWWNRKGESLILWHACFFKEFSSLSYCVYTWRIPSKQLSSTWQHVLSSCNFNFPLPCNFSDSLFKPWLRWSIKIKEARCQLTMDGRDFHSRHLWKSSTAVNVLYGTPERLTRCAGLSSCLSYLRQTKLTRQPCSVSLF